jgi:hypothetical protein
MKFVDPERNFFCRFAVILSNGMNNGMPCNRSRLLPYDSAEDSGER